MLTLSFCLMSSAVPRLISSSEATKPDTSVLKASVAIYVSIYASTSVPIALRPASLLSQFSAALLAAPVISALCVESALTSIALKSGVFAYSSMYFPMPSCTAACASGVSSHSARTLSMWLERLFVCSITSLSFATTLLSSST